MVRSLLKSCNVVNVVKPVNVDRQAKEING